MDDTFLSESKREASALLRGDTFGSIAEFDLHSIDLLNKYIKDKGSLKFIVSSKAFAYEVMFINGVKGTIFEDFMDLFFTNLNFALEDHKEDVLQYYVELDLNIHEALINYQDSAAIINVTNLENKRTIVKSGFTSLGDIIESSLYPQLELVYRVLTYSKGSSLYLNKNNFKKGKIVDELINSSEVIEAVLRQLLNGVALNHWRNISCHSSYKYNKTSDSIFCEFGTKNDKSVSLAYEEFFELIKSIDSIQILLKTCLELSSVELGVKKEIVSDDERYELTKESIMSQIGNALAILNYDVMSVEKILNQWKINIVDISSLGITKFREFGNELIPYFVCMYQVHGIVMELEVFDTKGRTFQRMSLGDISNKNLAK